MSKLLQRARFIVCLVLCSLLSISSAFASPTKSLVQAFVSAYEDVKQPEIKKEDLEHYFSYMSDDITDYHAAYGVTIKGKERKRKGILKKAQDMISFSMDIESIAIGSETAVVVVNEDSKYYKDGKLKHFKGRTIVVLEFNEKGLIQHMRRYLD
jgi:ketosteroid isomerase-like protein